MSSCFFLLPDHIDFLNLSNIRQAKEPAGVDLNPNDDDLYVPLISHFSHISISETIDSVKVSQIETLFGNNKESSITTFPDIIFKLKKPIVSLDRLPLGVIFGPKTEVVFTLSYEREFRKLVSALYSLMSSMKNLSSDKFKFKPFKASNIIIFLDRSTGSFKLDFDLSFQVSLLQNFYILPGIENLNHINTIMELMYIPIPTNYQTQFNALNQSPTVSSFYSLITDNTRKFHNNITKMANIDGIYKTLLPFQISTIQWMLQHEGKSLTLGENDNIELYPFKYAHKPDDEQISFILDTITPGWTRLADSSNDKISYWFNPFNGGICTSKYILHYLKAVDYNVPPAKAFLCEEMGLGKTIEVTTVIKLNPRVSISQEFQPDLLDPSRKFKQSKTTLIVCPETILNQWFDEITAAVPDLDVYEYKGITAMEERDSTLTPSSVAGILSTYDIVLTSYAILARELSRALFIPTTRPKRKSASYERIDYSSPLMLLEFHRLVLDEAQLASISMSSVAEFSRIIPRTHTWCVSGTLIRKNLKDLHSLMMSQRMFPYDIISSKQWEELPRHLFDRVFSNICIRHTKEMVVDQINLPKQSRIMLRAPFSTIEYDNYHDLFNRFLEQVGLNDNGEPTMQGFDVDRSKFIMQLWCNKLRIVCCHAMLNNFRRMLNAEESTSKKVAKNADSNLIIGTLDDVLKDLISNNESESHTAFYIYIREYIKTGKIKEFLREPDQSLVIFTNVIPIIIKRLEYYRAVQDTDSRWTIRITNMLEFLHQAYFMLASAHYQHYRPMKPLPETFEDLPSIIVDPEEEEYKAIDVTILSEGEKHHYELENEYYAKADEILNALLEEPLKRCSLNMQKISTTFDKFSKYTTKLPTTPNPIPSWLGSQEFELPAITLHFKDLSKTFKNHSTTMEISFILNRSQESMDELNKQAKVIDYWFLKLIDYQKIPVVRNADVDKTGEEYRISLISQEESQAYIDQLQMILDDREKALNRTEDSLAYSTAVRNDFIDDENDDEEDAPEMINSVKRVFKGEKENKNSSLFNELDQVRNMFAPQGTTNPRYSFRTPIIELLAELQLYTSDSEQHEQINLLIKLLRFELKSQMANVRTMKTKLFDLLNNSFNSKVSYFKQLQGKSDALVNYEPEKVTQSPKYAALVDLEQSTKEMKKQNERLTSFNARLNYLKTLNTKRSGGNVDVNDDLCVICRYRILVGTLTPCGHKYCRECLGEWMKTKQVCPICKKKLDKKELYNFTYSNGELKGDMVETLDDNNEEFTIVDDKKPQFLKADLDSKDTTLEWEENADDMNRIKLLKNRRLLEKDMDFVYQGLPVEQLRAISSIPLQKNYGTKVDMIIRQIKYLRTQQPGVQILIFSQWNPFLTLLGRALKYENVSFRGWTNQVGGNYSKSKVHRKDEITTKYDKLNKNIIEFKKDKLITCFLLNTFSHAAGLTFTNASHVFLCEPMVNLSFELQAINRIHRIGQTQKTTVWNFIIEGSIEESIAYLGTKKRIQSAKVRRSVVHEGNEEKVVEEIDENSLEAKELTKINQAEKDGEVIPDNDLWAAFFAARSANVIDNVYK